jgi:hypothetical protein
MDFKETGCKGVEWKNLDRHRDQGWALVNRVMNVLVP